MRIKGLCQAARPTGITARKATRRRGSSSFCAEEGDAVPDTVTHCVCVKDGSWRASSSAVCLPRFRILIQLQAALLLAGRFEINTRDFATLSALNRTYAEI